MLVGCSASSRNEGPAAGLKVVVWKKHMHFMILAAVGMAVCAMPFNTIKISKT